MGGIGLLLLYRKVLVKQFSFNDEGIYNAQKEMQNFCLFLLYK